MKSVKWWASITVCTIIAMVVVANVWYHNLTPEERAAMDKQAEEQRQFKQYQRQVEKANAIADDLMSDSKYSRSISRDAARTTALRAVQMCESETLSQAERSRMCSEREMQH